MQIPYIALKPTQHLRHSRSFIPQRASYAENATTNIQRRPLLFHALGDGDVIGFAAEGEEECLLVHVGG